MANRLLEKYIQVVRSDGIKTNKDVTIGVAGTTANLTVSGVIKAGNTGVGVYSGTGAPTLSAAQGSIYSRTDGSSASTRLYVSAGGTTWIAVTTAS